MRLAVCVPDGSGARWAEAFSRQRPDAQVTVWTSEAAPVPADFACVWAPPREFFDVHPPFKAVLNLGAGVDSILKLPDLPSLLKGAPLIRLNDAGMASQMAEYVTSFIARQVRGFDVYAAQQAETRWKKRAPLDKSEWPVGVMGMGSIGAVVARSISANGYPVAGWSRASKRVEGVNVFAGHESLNEFLSATRILVLVLPATRETESIVDAKALSRLKPGGLVINIGRGALIDDAALIAALDSGRLSHAVLDVFREEPLPADHPFWRHPGITVTPHVSGFTLVEPSVRQILDKIAALERGETVEGAVDLGRGY
jgi:glyoxylate/hydroxypyruvate reductase A